MMLGVSLFFDLHAVFFFLLFFASFLPFKHFHIYIKKAFIMAPLTFVGSSAAALRRRQEDGGQSSQPFWISVVACVVLIILVCSLAFIAYSCIKARRRRLEAQKAREADVLPSAESPKAMHREEKQGHDRPIGPQLPVAPPVPTTPDKRRHGYTGGNQHKNLTWKERAASLGQKSVRSVQWVSFRSSMDRRPAQPSTEWVVVNKSKDEKEGED
ncbi:hypothetical protein BCR43DRAFT_151931 [Syncephalastrum racemosum]|uniref:Uncharacterized protein n=1 Tax=Syncephalastrum racemosum TaxID=13706 RepID=A0A1X2HMX8_SYNRA|nr:hypothetical protein BCR43DRAFT_151931 [Syncephalastrum racemosum]